VAAVFVNLLEERPYLGRVTQEERAELAGLAAAAAVLDKLALPADQAITAQKVAMVSHPALQEHLSLVRLVADLVQSRRTASLA